MLRILLSGAIIVLAASAPADAALTKDQCQTLAATFAKASVAMGSIVDSIRALNFPTYYADQATGEQQKTLAAMIAAEKGFRTASTAYLTAMQDATYQMQLCSR